MADSKLVSRATDGTSLTDFLEREDLKNFLELLGHSGEENQLVSITFPVPSFDPLAALEMLSKKSEFNFYWDRPDHQFSFSAAKSVAVLKREGTDRFDRISRDVREIGKTSASFSLVNHSLSGIQLVGRRLLFFRSAEHGLLEAVRSGLAGGTGMAPGQRRKIRYVDHHAAQPQ